jgi:hypothetical protein
MTLDSSNYLTGSYEAEYEADPVRGQPARSLPGAQRVSWGPLDLPAVPQAGGELNNLPPKA